MSTKQNVETSMVRNYVKRWLSNQNGKAFTVNDLIDSSEDDQIFKDVNRVKALSNELIRLKVLGVVAIIGEQKRPVGRPANVYQEVWCDDTLDVLKGDVVPSKVLCTGGNAYVYVFLKGMTRILKGYKVHSKKNVKELIEHHLKKIENSA